MFEKCLVLCETEYLKILDTEYHWKNSKLFETDTECEHDNVGLFWGTKKWKLLQTKGSSVVDARLISSPKDTYCHIFFYNFSTNPPCF